MTDGAHAYHLVGIGGIGMSAIARLLLARGARVSGSDAFRSALTDELVAEGATVAVGHRAENVGDVDLVVVSSAIAHENPEYATALARGLAIVTRGEMLARLCAPAKTVAIAGTHGKTTTTAMTAAIFEAAGLAPTYAIGGVRTDTGTNARSGEGAWFVTEADESDGSFLHLHPTIACVTNVENDHLASDAELPALFASFARFARAIPAGGHAVIGLDDPGSAQVARDAAVPTTTFATHGNADLVAREIVYAGLGSSFTLLEHGVALGTVRLRVPGEINVRNALAAIGCARAAGVDVAAIVAALDTFRGVRRRYEIVGERDGLVIVDDYAHHPTAIAQTIAATRGVTDAPVVVAFQPHRYSRTAYLAAGFATALAHADRVILTPVYAASEAPIPGVSERSIGEPLERAGTPVTYVSDAEELLDVVPRVAGDRAVVLMLGAGSISGIAHRLGRRITATAAAR